MQEQRDRRAHNSLKQCTLREHSRKSNKASEQRGGIKQARKAEIREQRVGSREHTSERSKQRLGSREHKEIERDRQKWRDEKME